MSVNKKVTVPEGGFAMPTVSHGRLSTAGTTNPTGKWKDLDGDGVLSRDEACEFQAELRRRVDTPAGSPGTEPVSRLDAIDESLLTETLCCNCDRGAENSAPWIDKRSDACQSDEGVSR